MNNSSRRGSLFEYRSKYPKRNPSNSQSDSERSDGSCTNYPPDRQRIRNREIRKSTSPYQHRQKEKTKIKIQQKASIQIINGPQPSQIKVHFRFNGIRIQPKHQQEFLQKIKRHFSEVGPVTYLGKSSNIMEIGFKTDESALKVMQRKMDTLIVTLYDKKVQISAFPTNIFQLWLKLNKHIKPSSYSSSSSSSASGSRQPKRKGLKNYSCSRSFSSLSSQAERFLASSRRIRKSKERSTHSRRVQKSRQHSDSHHRSREKFDRSYHNKNQLRHKKYENEKRQSIIQTQTGSQLKNNQERQVYKTLLFFGINFSYSAKNVDSYLDKHSKGSFKSKQKMIWKRLNESSVCQILEGIFEQKMAKKLLEINDKLQIEGHPFVVIDSELKDKHKISKQISKYQVNMKFPHLVEPYYLIKSLKECGKVIQIVSNNQLTESGLSESYNVTFSSKETCNELTNIRKTSRGINIYEVKQEDYVPIYRQKDKLQLKPSKDVDKFQQPKAEIGPYFSINSERKSQDLMQFQ